MLSYSTCIYPLAKLSGHHEANSNNVDCKVTVSLKLCSSKLRDRNLHQTMNFLKKYDKPIESNDDALKFWRWLQGESKGNNKTINRHLESLKPICSYFADIPKLKASQPKQEKPFTKSEIKQIIDVFDQEFSHYSAFIKFLFSTGCRTSEAIALTWDKVDFEAKTITISKSIGIAKDGSKIRKETKTGVIRVIPIGIKIENLLEIEFQSWLLSPINHEYQRNNLVFPTSNGRFIDIRNL